MGVHAPACVWICQEKTVCSCASVRVSTEQFWSSVYNDM